MEVAGKHVVITGAASGGGRAMALRFAEEGARGWSCRTWTPTARPRGGRNRLKTR